MDVKITFLNSLLKDEVGGRFLAGYEHFSGMVFENPSIASSMWLVTGMHYVLWAFLNAFRILIHVSCMMQLILQIDSDIRGW